MNLDQLSKRGVKINISDLSPLECFLKAFSIAEKAKDEEGREAAKLGLLAVTEGGSSSFNIVAYSDEKVIEEASLIRRSHKDPFDCFIFATAKALGAALVTEDTSAVNYLGHDHVLAWKSLKKLLSQSSI